MAGIGEALIGIYHFLADRTPHEVDIVPAKARKVNPFCHNGRSLVSRVRVDGDVKASIVQSVELIGGLSMVISPGDRVMVKPNFNSPDPYPGSTDLHFLGAVLELLAELGARVSVGDSAGGIWRPTRRVVAKLGVAQLLERTGAELVIFEDRPKDWVRVEVEGDYLRGVTLPRSAYEADRMVYLPCMKTHALARFSLSLKLAVGFLHPGERRALHFHNLEQKIAELSLAWQPDLIIMDGRKAFVSGGPATGQLVEPGVIMASGDPVAIDVEALKMLVSYDAKNRLVANVWELPTIAHALKHGLGAKDREYQVVQ